MSELLNSSFSELKTRFDEELSAFWVTMEPQNYPCFTPNLLNELKTQYTILQNSKLVFQDKKLRYVISSSNAEGVYNYGGDLKLFVELIRREDRQALLDYASLCIDSQYLIFMSFFQPVMTIALVEGNALGGGFEMLLSHDFIIAEKGTKFGLTEIIFNLFPGMGAYSFLSRKIGPIKTEQMMLKGEIMTAEQLHELGIVDVIAEPGEGKQALRKFIEKNNRRFETLRSIYQIRKSINPITHKELMDITTMWVDTALKQNPLDLKKMDRLARAQEKKHSKEVQLHHTNPSLDKISLIQKYRKEKFLNVENS